MQKIDFNKIYKGEISKSGAAILPSKRVRKIPEKIFSKTGQENPVKEKTKEEDTSKNEDKTE